MKSIHINVHVYRLFENIGTLRSNLDDACLRVDANDMSCRCVDYFPFRRRVAFTTVPPYAPRQLQSAFRQKPYFVWVNGQFLRLLILAKIMLYLRCNGHFIEKLYCATALPLRRQAPLASVVIPAKAGIQCVIHAKRRLVPSPLRGEG